MENVQPPLLAAPATPGVPAAAARRRSLITLKLLFIAGLVLLLQLPLSFVNLLRQDRLRYPELGTAHRIELGGGRAPEGLTPTELAAEGYRMVDRALKYGLLVVALTFAAFFLFEVLANLRLHPVHYSLVGAAMCLFYLALLALGEVFGPKVAYLGAAVASSALVVLYAGAILRSWARATLIASLLTIEYGVLYVVLRMENYALLAGTATLFVAIGALMYFTRNVDWFAQEVGREARA